MKKFGTILITILVVTILYEIVVPTFEPQWLRFVIEIAAVIVSGFIGLGIFKSMGNKNVKTASH